MIINARSLLSARLVMGTGRGGASISHHVGERQQLVPIIDYILINQLVVGSRFYPMPWLSPL